MTTFFCTHQLVSRFLIAGIWMVVSFSDITGHRVVKGNIQSTLQKHDDIRRARRSNAALTLLD